MSRLRETFRIGALEIAALSDGAPDRELSGFFKGIDPPEWIEAVGITDPADPVPFNFGSFLVRGDGHTTLIDSGYGAPAKALGIPGGGELLDRLGDIGVGHGDIDVVVHTHLHADHCGWDSHAEDEGGPRTPTFPKAKIYVQQAELDYWTGPSSEGNPLAAAARAAVLPVRDAGQIETFEGEFSPSESLTMVPTPGHTPGHCSVMLTSQSEHLLIVGDAAHHPVHLEHHDWIPGVDLDPAESSRSRLKVAKLAVERDAVVTGGHFPILSLGKVREVEGGYRWEAL